MSLEVLHHDNHLLALAKPAGLPTVPDDSGDPSLLDLARAWVEETYAKPGRAFLGVVHRLDRPVSGVVLFARTSKAASRLTRQFQQGTTRKTYLAVTHGAPSAEAGTLEQWLRKDRARNRVTAFPRETEGAKRAVTDWRVLAREEARTLVELEPKTGRSHQLRVALATLGAPIQGDLRYGPGPALPDRSIALHARALEVQHPTLGERVGFSCPPPRSDVWRFRSESL